MPAAFLFVALLLLSACASQGLVEEPVRAAPSFASQPATSGQLAAISGRIEAAYGPHHSGFRLLDASHDALAWRLALIDSATSSLDILTYLWYPDASGELILERAISAARRGVRVRLVVDDLMTMGQDRALVNIEALPNLELRLFNPWRNRNLGSRAGEMIAEMERLNSRMHDKLLIVDGHAVIVGGRNIGDHYFGLNPNYNFHDLDLLAIGALAEDANGMFDEFWNSDLLASAAHLTAEADPEAARASWQRLQVRNRESEKLASFIPRLRNWDDDLAALEPQLRPGTGYLVYDEVATGQIRQGMIRQMFGLFEQAQEELLITNAYIIPGEPAIEMLERLNGRGVDIRILTNSLASHDVPAVNSHYEPWRKSLVEAGADLYELRADAAIQSIVDIPPIAAGFVGLHTKAAVVDNRHVFVGSMNLDPRSALINTEMGAIIDSPALAADLKAIMERDMGGDNAWQVSIAEDGDLRWTNADETVTSQPRRGFMQSVMNTVFKVVPREQF
jgi:putative cardiolipin synthase